MKAQFFYQNENEPSILMRGKANGHDAVILLDTGNVGTYDANICAQLARKIAFDFTPDPTLPEGRVREGNLGNLEIGPFSFSNLRCDFKSGPLHENDSHINLGGKFLSDKIVEIDYKAKLVDFNAAPACNDSHRASLVAAFKAASSSVSFELIGGYSPFFEIHVNGVGPLNFLFDTGCTQLVVSSDLLKRCGLNFLEQEFLVEYADRMEKRSDLRGLSSVSLAGIERDVDTIVLDDLLERLRSTISDKIDGILPGRFFDQSVITLDYSKQTMHVFTDVSEYTDVPEC